LNSFLDNANQTYVDCSKPLICGLADFYSTTLDEVQGKSSYFSMLYLIN